MKDFLQADADGAKALTADLRGRPSSPTAAKLKEGDLATLRVVRARRSNPHPGRTAPSHRWPALAQVQFRAFKAMLKFKRLCDESG